MFERKTTQEKAQESIFNVSNPKKFCFNNDDLLHQYLSGICSVYQALYLLHDANDDENDSS